MQHIRKGDEVIVLAGRDKKRRGVVLARVGADRVLVEGINIVKKHQKPNPMTGSQGGVVNKTMPIHISNVAIYNPESGKADKVSIKEVDGHKVRVYRSNGETVGVKA